MSKTQLDLSRDEIVRIMEGIARARRGTSAQKLLLAYHEGSLDDPGELIDFLSLADLLSPDDPIHKG